MTPLERSILAHAHAHHLDGEEWGDTESLSGRDWVLTDAKAEWLAEKYPDVDPALTAYYKRFNDIDWDELAREKGIVCRGGMGDEYIDSELE